MMRVLLLCLLLPLSVTSQPLLALASSSAFALELRPTSANLTQQDIDFVEQSIHRSIDNQDHTFIDIEAVVQSFSFDDPVKDHPFTSVRFQVLGTVLARDRDKDNQRILDELIIRTFKTSTLERSKFLSYIRRSNRPLLQNVADIQLVSIRNENGTGGGRSKLSTLDIVLICICGAIFLGILYMVVQSQIDAGFSESLRVARVNRQPADAFPTKVVATRDVGNSADTESIEDPAPSTSSTGHSVDLEFNVTASTPERSNLSSEKASSPRSLLESKVSKSSSFERTDSLEDALPEVIENDWFGKFRQEEKDNEGDYSDMTADIFGVDVASTVSSDDSKAKSVAVSEWMKTIRVVPSGGKTASVVSTSSADPSTESPNLEVSSLEEKPLDLDMAASIEHLGSIDEVSLEEEEKDEEASIPNDKVETSGETVNRKIDFV